MIKITPEENDLFCQYIEKISGIHLGREKAYLLETRLAGLLEEECCTSFLALYHKTESINGHVIQQKIIDRISTNETLFFRDTRPFELLQHKILPDLIDARRAGASGFFPTPIRIWSAACSTGQEVYSIAIVLKELLGDLTGYRIRLLGTDLSNQAIAQARRGEYNQFEIKRGLSNDKLEKYFDHAGGIWKIRDDIKAMVTFKTINLLEPFQGLDRFDIVFCRNVGVYFSMENRKKLFKKIAAVLEKDGYLIIGGTESLMNVDPGFIPRRYLRSVFYQPLNNPENNPWTDP